jgi:hypothetical protein
MSLSEWLRFNGKDYQVSYAPYDVMETFVRCYQFTNCKLDYAVEVNGYWYYLGWQLQGLWFRWAIPTAVVEYVRRRFDKVSPDDLRCPPFLRLDSPHKVKGLPHKPSNSPHKEMPLKPSCGMDCTGLTEYCACAEEMHDIDRLNEAPGDVDKLALPEVQG